MCVFVCVQRLGRDMGILCGRQEYTFVRECVRGYCKRMLGKDFGKDCGRYGGIGFG